MKIALKLENGELIGTVQAGQLEIRVAPSVVKAALHAASRKHWVGADAVGGFWDSLSGGLGWIKHLTDIPLVHTIVTAIPYGGTALAAVDVAAMGINAGRKMLAKMHPAVHHLVHRAASGDVQAQAVITQIHQNAAHHPGIAAMSRDVQIASNVLADMTDIHSFLQAHVLTPHSAAPAMA
jgi:hypothetical protein